MAKRAGDEVGHRSTSFAGGDHVFTRLIPEGPVAVLDSAIGPRRGVNVRAEHGDPNR